MYLKKPTEVISPLSVKTGNDLRLYRSDNATYARFNYAGSSVGLDIDDLNGDGINLQQAGVNKLRIETNGNATFAGDVEIAANLFSTGNNLKFHAAGTHVMNIDLNGKVYPNTHNAYDLGYSTSLAWRNLYLSGTATIPTIASNTNFTGDIYQYGSTFRTSSFINLLNNRNTKKYLETAYFTNGVSNQAVNIQFINAAHQGFYKITLSGSYSNQDISGKLTKVIPFGYNPNGSIWRTGNNQSEITIATGGVSTNFTIGNLAWDSTNSKFIIPIYKLTSTGNSVKILVEYLGGAANNLKDVTLSSNYTQAAPSPFNVRQYRNIRDRLGIGTTNPATKLEVNGGLIKVVDSGDTAFYGGDYVRVFGTQSYGFRNSAGSAIAQISLTGNSYFNGGNVGIGTTSPQDKLNLHTSSASGNIGMKITRGTETHGLRLGVNSSHAFLWTTEAQNLVFATSGIQRISILSGGNVGIGTTNPTAPLMIAGSGADGTAMLRLEATAGSTTFNWISSVIYPNLAAGKTAIKLFGQAQSTNNQAWMGFKYAGSGSTSNMLTFGFYANNFLVNLLANGNLGNRDGFAY